MGAPFFCFYCRNYGDADWCSSCAALIKPILSTRIAIDRLHEIEVHAVSAYEDPLKTLIVAKGWSDYSATVLLGRLMWYFSAIQRIPFDYLMPIPLHTTKLASRGYNQALVLAQEISKLSGKPLATNLYRVRKTASQATLPLHKRASNLSQAFCLKNDNNLQGKTVILIDDVMTSGATLQAAGRALLEARPQKIYAVVACRALLG